MSLFVFTPYSVSCTVIFFSPSVFNTSPSGLLGPS